MLGTLKSLLGVAQALKGEGKGLLVSVVGLVEKLPLLVEHIPSAAQLEQLKARAFDLEQLSRSTGGDEIASLGSVLTPLLAQAFSQTKKPIPADGYSVEQLFTPTADDLGSLWPVYGSALAMAIVQTLRELDGADPEASALQWGAFQKEAVGNGEWWRVFTHAFVHTDRRQAIGEITATVGFSTAIARLGSPALAFSMFRLGIFVGLLSEMFERPAKSETLTSVSGPAFCLLGALVATMLLNRQHIKTPSAEDIPAGMLVFLTGFNLLGSSMGANGGLTRSQALSALAGVGAAGLAHIISQFDQKKSK